MNIAATDQRGFSLAETLVVTAVLAVTLGIATSLFVQGNNTYAAQREYDEARSSAAASLDMTVRLLRGATTIMADPDGNNAADSVRVISDWNPRDGDLTDAYEDVTFTVAGGTLFKQEPTDVAPVAFADRVASLTFNYWNSSGVAIANPWAAAQNTIALVGVTVISTPINGRQITVTSSASVRRNE